MDALCKNVSCDEWAMGPTGNCLLQKTTGRPVGSCPKFKADWPGADDPAVSVSRKGYESADEAGKKGEQEVVGQDIINFLDDVAEHLPECNFSCLWKTIDCDDGGCTLSRYQRTASELYKKYGSGLRDE